MNVQQSTLSTDPPDCTCPSSASAHWKGCPRGDYYSSAAEQDNDPGCTCHGIEWSFTCFEHCNRPKPAQREPPEPDGECFRGGEAASALAEEQGRIQRTLK